MTAVGPDNFLNRAWDMNYGPDGYLWVTERTEGVILRVNPDDGSIDELVTIADVSSTAGQDGLLGIALHPQILSDSPYVYASYTYLQTGQRRQRIVRFTYALNGNDGSLSSPKTLIEGLPSSNDHNSGRLLYGPDGKLYYSIGDQGANQGGNYCKPNLAQELPSQAEINGEDWSNYPGKILRINTDGSIPQDNPSYGGVQSHIFTIGHRNPQGLVFGSNGLLYSDEHGPDTDDEVNILYGGKNYGWPRVAGLKDDQAYDYCNWSSASNCSSLSYSKSNCPANATFQEENTFTDTAYQEPLFPMFAVSDNYNFNDPACENSWICRPNVAPSSIGIYESDSIPGWKNSLLVVSLKRGRIFRLKLNSEGTAVVGDTIQHFYTTNRYRDIAVAPDGKTIYILTDPSGKTSGPSGLTQTSNLQNPGTILKFTYQGSATSNEKKASEVFSLWPNPASDRLHFDLKQELKGPFQARLINMAGQVVQDFEEIQRGTKELSIGKLPAGIYVFSLSTDAGNWQKRIIITR